MAGKTSLGARAVAGAAWTILTGAGSRALGLVGTIVLTYFLSRDLLGGVSDAAIVTILASQLSTVGIGAYLVSKANAGRDVAWHATVLHLGLGIIALAVCIFFMGPIGRWLQVPTLGLYVPGFVLSTFFDRCLLVPERLLYRDMRFRLIGIERTAGELTYTILSVTLAMLGVGGMSIVYANIARSFLRLVIVVRVVPRADWLTPFPLSKKIFRELLSFGIPFSISASASQASCKFDNALMSSFFGPQVVGVYNLAYNVADVPANQVGEQIGDVLLPSFARMEGEARKAALVRSTGLLTLVVSPLAVGLGVIAPTLVHAILRAEWADVAPMLTILSALSVTRPVGWTISSYLIARSRPGLIMGLEIFKLASLVVFMFALRPLGPLWTAGAVGCAFTAHTIASVVLVNKLDDIPPLVLVKRALPPVVACLPMVVAVLAARWAMHRVGLEQKFVTLALELICGAAAYIASALVIARSTAKDFLELLMRVIRRRRAPEPLEPTEPAAVP
jgi:lipopolysaccharide exporter